MDTREIVEAIGTMTLGVCITDSARRVTSWSKGAQQILGYSKEEMEGRYYNQLISLIAVGPVATSDEYSERRIDQDSGHVSQPVEMTLRDAAGRHRRMRVADMTLQGEIWDDTLTIYIFEDADFASRHVEEEIAIKNGTAPAALSPREHQVLSLLALQRTPEQIAETMGRSVHTVLNHIRNAREKLEARSQLEAVLRAIALGLVYQPAVTSGDESDPDAGEASMPN